MIKQRYPKMIHLSFIFVFLRYIVANKYNEKKVKIPNTTTLARNIDFTFSDISINMPKKNNETLMKAEIK